jgi:hypothetical protein
MNTSIGESVAAHVGLAAEACAASRRCLDRGFEDDRVDVLTAASTVACLAESRSLLHRIENASAADTLSSVERVSAPGVSPALAIPPPRGSTEAA